jgi:hypothetical protein
MSLTSYYEFYKTWIGDVMFGVLSSSAVDHGFEAWAGQIKDYNIGICCFSSIHACATLRRKGNDWLSRNEDNVSACCDVSIRGLSVQWANTIKKNPTKRVGVVQSGPHHHLIEN